MTSSVNINFKALTIIYTFCICLAVLFSSAITSETAELDCIWCHEELTKGKYLHAPVDMGCKTCHASISNRHKNTGQFKRGLSAKEPDVCFGCHDSSKFTKKSIHSVIKLRGCTGCHDPHSSKDPKFLKAPSSEICFTCHEKAMFTKKLVHVAIGMGCSACHDPHSTEYPNNLVQKMPDLCFGCHEDTDFLRKNKHKPVADNRCMRCHNPHSTDDIALLRREPNRVCLECHQRVTRKPHAISTFHPTKGHPLGGDYKKEDPVRPNKTFYCGSCHDPHSSDEILLFRYKPKDTTNICISCHKI